MTKRLRITVLITLSLTVVAVGISWAVFRVFSGGVEESTDNAYFAADITAIAPKVSGYIVDVPITDNQPVQKGDVLFRIDDADYRARLRQAEAAVSSAVADLTNADAELRLHGALIEQAKAEQRSAEAAAVLAALNLDRYASLVQSSAASRQRFEEAQAARDQADAALSAAVAMLDAQEKKIDVLAARKEAASAGLALAQAQRDLAQIDLDNTVVVAPTAGVVGNRQVRVGRYVSPGSTLLTLVPLDTVWLIANFKETQLEAMQVGQSARIRVDGYPDLEITGRVDSLAPGSGAAFSLFPADNATGNFVRIVQRVPVKIVLDDNVLRGRLVPGLSARVSVDTAALPQSEPSRVSQVRGR